MNHCLAYSDSTQVGAVEFALFIVFALIILIIISVVLSYKKSPFEFPYFYQSFDVSGKRQPKIEDYIDNYIIKYKMYPFDCHLEKISEWEEECKQIIANSFFKEQRKRQFEECLDYDNAFIFTLEREQTRYTQYNYVKSPYKVSNTDTVLSLSYKALEERCNKLSHIDFSTTLNAYHEKNQRNLMTDELRKTIMIRDNYTCQICRKVMSDGFGIEIDHIIPISKGGKTIESNLRVLCYKCNRSKSNKL